MCGFIGILGCDNNDFDEIIKLSSYLNHRGPDGSGSWYSAENQICMAHKRLSILDLSSRGNQPMMSQNERWVIAYNGEIYNHLKMREKIISNFSVESNYWRGTSDTESLLSFIEKFGIEKTLKFAEGMFAFALWDNKNKELILARDRFGEKPLYYSQINRKFIFASDLKAISNYNGFDREIDQNTLNYFINFSYVPKNLTIFKKCFKVTSGSFQIIKLDDFQIIEKKYWDLQNKFIPDEKKENIDSHSAIKLIDNKLNQAVKKQLISDVPIGCFLSGGIDSTLISYYMQKNSINKIDTYSIGFDSKTYDESAYAKQTAEFLNTNHNVHYISESEIAEIVPKISDIYSEPFADSSQIPTYLVSKLASNKSKVVLSGDGADELFGGYNRYLMAMRYWSIINKSPHLLKLFIEKIISINDYKLVSFILDKIKFFLPRKYHYTNNINILYKLSFALKAKNFQELILFSKGVRSSSSKIIANQFKLENNTELYQTNYSNLDIMIFDDLNNYLQDDILCKLDRASMSNSLEARVPFLDPQVVDLSFKIPNNFKIKNGENKWILRQLLSKIIPKKIYDRPKMGFSLPIGDILNNSLKDWCENLVNRTSLKNEGIFDYDEISNIWEKHKRGNQKNTNLLWNFFIFQDWYLKNKC